LQIYLSAAPQDAQQAAAYGRPLAHMAYRIGPGSTLLRQNLLLQSRGGLLSVSDREAPPIPSPEELCAAVLRECGRRGYSGVVLDFEEPPRQDRQAFAQLLSRQLRAGRRTLYVSEAYASAVPDAVALLCTAMSGGGFSRRLQEAARQRGGGDRLALDVQRLRMDFRLPAPSGEGTPLEAEALRRLMAERSPAVFFSPELCARYFTYAQHGETHFVLFDDAGTMAQKVRIGTSLGFSASFFMWPEVQDIAGELFRK
jgi:hypothetical protein